MAVMTGDAETAGGRVLTSDSTSRVFVNFSDHGAPGLIAFPSAYLYAD
jgi:legumain